MDALLRQCVVLRVQPGDVVFYRPEVKLSRDRVQEIQRDLLRVIESAGVNGVTVAVSDEPCQLDIVRLEVAVSGRTPEAVYPEL